jgi:predicted SprT family Zn-dependent metalloprotease
MEKPLTVAQLNDIAIKLEDYHKVFYTFWEASTVVFSDQIPTAAVQFLNNDTVKLMINEKFWNSLSETTKHFVICHECLHIILDHGFRNGKNIPGATPELVNMAQDITINEMIVHLFGIQKSDVDNWEKYCWIETCFENSFMIKVHQDFEYYLRLLIKNDQNPSKSKKPELVDSHSTQGSSCSPSPGSCNAPGEKIKAEDDGDGNDLSQDQDAAEGKSDKDKGSKGKDNQEEIDKAIDALGEKLAKDLEVDTIKDVLDSIIPEAEIKSEKAGKGSSFLSRIINKKTAIRKVDFSTIVKGIKATRIKKQEISYESFKVKDRKYQSIMKTGKIKLPGYPDQERDVKSKLNICLCMDVSGSCIPYLRDFEKVAASFLREKDLFDVTMYTFDTRMKLLPKLGNYPYGGGTAFDIIENEMLAIEAKNCRYPDAVIVITDGYGNDVLPKHMNRWVVLGTSNYTMENFPNKTRNFPLSRVTFNEVS